MIDDGIIAGIVQDTGLSEEEVAAYFRQWAKRGWVELEERVVPGRVNLAGGEWTPARRETLCRFVGGVSGFLQNVANWKGDGAS